MGGIEKGHGVCCPSTCKVCGGKSCAKTAKDVGLTPEDCCAQKIIESGVSCEEVDGPPCILGMYLFQYSSIHQNSVPSKTRRCASTVFVRWRHSISLITIRVNDVRYSRCAYPPHPPHYSVSAILARCSAFFRKKKSLKVLCSRVLFIVKVRNRWQAVEVSVCTVGRLISAGEGVVPHRGSWPGEGKGNTNLSSTNKFC